MFFVRCHAREIAMVDPHRDVQCSAGQAGSIAANNALLAVQSILAPLSSNAQTTFKSLYVAAMESDIKSSTTSPRVSAMS
jgi:hypothetical protein